MAIKAGITFVEWVARLTKGYTKYTGKPPDNLAKLKINMEAAQKVKDQSKVIKGDFNPKEEWWKSRPEEKGGITSIKTGKKLEFASAKEFEEDLYSSTQNFIKNNPQFNLELAKTFQKPGVKTYGWTPSGDKSKLLSPQQRQKKLD